MFKDLTAEEKSVLNLLAKADMNKDFKEIELETKLSEYKNIDSIRLSLFDKGYINLKVYDRNSRNIQTEYTYINGHILVEAVFNYYKELNNKGEV